MDKALSCRSMKRSAMPPIAVLIFASSRASTAIFVKSIAARIADIAALISSMGSSLVDGCVRASIVIPRQEPTKSPDASAAALSICGPREDFSPGPDRLGVFLEGA